LCILTGAEGEHPRAVLYILSNLSIDFFFSGDLYLSLIKGQVMEEAKNRGGVLKIEIKEAAGEGGLVCVLDVYLFGECLYFLFFGVMMS